MSKEKVTQLTSVFMIVIVMFLIGLVSLNQQAEASPPMAPTPIANLVSSDDATNVTFLASGTEVTADQDTTGRQIPEFEWCDIQYVIDQDAPTTGPNTTTLTIQFSNDNENWVSGPALVSNNNSDATDLTRIPLFGRYVSVDVNVTNSVVTTMTILGLCK